MQSRHLLCRPELLTVFFVSHPRPKSPRSFLQPPRVNQLCGLRVLGAHSKNDAADCGFVNLCVLCGLKTGTTKNTKIHKAIATLRRRAAATRNLASAPRAARVRVFRAHLNITIFYCRIYSASHTPLVMSTTIKGWDIPI